MAKLKPHYPIVILGAGTAGLTAMAEAKRHTRDILMVDPGPLGTTCARVGCMPSKALLQPARDFHRYREWQAGGQISGAPAKANVSAILAHVRGLRDDFIQGPIQAAEGLGEQYVSGRARFLSADTLEVDGQPVTADAVIVATGTRPVVPQPWRQLGERLLTSDTLFEQTVLPERIGVIGLGAIGAELGQALGLLGLEVHAFARGGHIAGLDDPAVNEKAVSAVGRHVTLHLGSDVTVSDGDKGIQLSTESETVTVDAVLAAVGRQPNVEDLNLAALGTPLDEKGLPAIDPERLNVAGTQVYLVGDLNGQRALMHEAADEGRMAAYHALHPEAQCLKRRTPLGIVFCEPEIAQVGLRHGALPDSARVGETDFSKQGRARVMGQARGLLRVYADSSGRLLGAQMIMPEAEHIAHELAWLIQLGTDVETALQLPFYHPVLEEGLRSALQDIRRQMDVARQRPDLPLCGDQDDPLPGA